MRIHFMATARAKAAIAPTALEYLGIIPVSELISSLSLASLVGLSGGSRIDTDWLMFRKGNQVRYVSRGPMRHGMTWNHIHNAGVAYGKLVTISGKQFTCRLIKGADTDPTSGNVAAAGGEFNELFYSICSGRDPSYTGPILANLTTTSLGFFSANGFAAFCQETRDTNATAKLRRNTTKGNIRTGSFAGNTYANSESGWWPVLEEVI